MDKLKYNYLNIPTIETKRLILNGPLEKFAAKPLKTVQSGDNSLKKAEIGKSLLQKHL